VGRTRRRLGNHIYVPFTNAGRQQDSGTGFPTSDIPWLRRTNGEIQMHIHSDDTGGVYCDYAVAM